jgi:opacity protein-like surface antigen
MIKRISIITVLIIVLMGQVLAQEFAPVGTAVAQFLEIGMSARATAMGEAFTAVTDDASSVFWNPAGMAAVEKRNLFLAYNSWPAEIAVGGMSFAYGLGNAGVVGISAVYLMTDNMPVTTVFDPEGNSGETFSLSNYAFGISYARYMTEYLSVGITGKIVSEDYYGYGYSAIAIDLGTLYETGYHGLNIAMSILHFGPEVTFDGSYIDYSDDKSYGANEPKEFENFSLPINFRVGLAMDVVNGDANKVIAAIDMVHPNNNLEQYNLGMEYGYKQLFFVRGGYKFTTDEGGLALGVGVDYGLSDNFKFNLDYAYADFGVLTATHRLSFGLIF